MFHCNTVEEEAAAPETVNTDYERHSRAARDLAEAHFDAQKIIERILNIALA